MKSEICKHCDGSGWTADPTPTECPHCVEGRTSAPASHDRAELGIDGNCGFALLGPDIQEGEAEFAEIQEGRHPDNQLVACKKALAKLRERLGKPDLNYYFGTSHPYGG